MNFKFSQPIESLQWSGPAEKARINMDSIRIIHEIKETGRLATESEQETLSRYVGWGDINVLNYAMEKLDIAGNVREAEWKSIKDSTLNAHYTSLPVIDAIWQGLYRLGAGKIDSPRIIDPSAGTGHFLSACSIQGEWAEVEIEPVTASILSALHPSSKVFAQGYETVSLPKNWFDIAVSNVPFGNYPVTYSGLPRRLCSTIHDFFFVRTIELLRPGGVMAFITSRFTMDKKEKEVREYLGRYLDLLGGVRLPNNAFKENAGTEVVTDILFMQKRHVENNVTPDWISTDWLSVPHHKNNYYGRYQVNNYFINHPENVLGIQSTADQIHGYSDYSVLPDERDIRTSIIEALQNCLPQDALVENGHQEISGETSKAEIIVVRGTLNPEQSARIQEMREIYTSARELILAEVAGKCLAETDAMREKLNAQYDSFINLFGPISSISNSRLLKDTPELPFLLALENNFDTTTNTAEKAAIFSQSTVRQTAHSDKVNSIEDALLVCLDQIGKVDIDRIAKIAAVSSIDVIRDLGGVKIFRLPGTDKWVTEDDYLSGNVAGKLEDAELAIKRGTTRTIVTWSDTCSFGSRLDPV